ncbi:hypothetical protein CICLE_v10033929mg [Citrus x clementina]|uniref:F-box domain-containing protein n=1 Tax=Citrus clementina TaxID=85681 RepID=V4THV2_CITCL|nr:hypothetical protein CICLE_v10033929mg [Citrus x clementina]
MPYYKIHTKVYKEWHHICLTILDLCRNQVFEGTKDEDFISELPDDILFRIISPLPYETLVQTRTLSKRWRELWKRAPDFCGTIDGIPIVITSLLDPFYRQTATHNHREVQLHFGHSGGLLATIEDNGTLHLNFSDGGQETRKHFDWRLNLNCRFIVPKAFSFGFQSVKSLHLNCVNHLTKEKVSFLISYLLLESLHITDCKGLWSLFIHCSSSLKTLKIVNCLALRDIDLFTDKLENLCFQGKIPWLWLHGMPFLENVMFESPPCSDSCRPSLLQSLVRVVNVKILTVSGWLFTEALRIRPEFIMKQNILLKNLKELRDALTNKVKNTCLNNLRVIKFENFTNEHDEFKLTKRLQKVASVGAIFLTTPNGE